MTNTQARQLAKIAAIVALEPARASFMRPAQELEVGMVYQTLASEIERRPIL